MPARKCDLSGQGHAFDEFAGGNAQAAPEHDRERALGLVTQVQCHAKNLPPFPQPFQGGQQLGLLTPLHELLRPIEN